MDFHGKGIRWRQRAGPWRTPADRSWRATPRSGTRPGPRRPESWRGVRVRVEVVGVEAGGGWGGSEGGGGWGEAFLGVGPVCLWEDHQDSLSRCLRLCTVSSLCPKDAGVCGARWGAERHRHQQALAVREGPPPSCCLHVAWFQPPGGEFLYSCTLLSTLPPTIMEVDRRALEDYVPFGEPLCALP